MKTWKEATIIELDVKETAFGPYSPDVPDSEKTAVTDDNGNILGWKTTYGSNTASTPIA